MPELPEVENVKRHLEKHILDKKIHEVICFRDNLRFELPRDFHKIHGQTITKIERHGKYLLWTMGEHILLSHLGMTGRFLFQNTENSTAFPAIYYQDDSPKTEKHCHVRFEFSDNSSLDYIDPRRFGFIELFHESQKKHNAFLKKLGIDALLACDYGDYFYEKIRSSQKNIKTLLLEQSIFAGIGNIYASEALWRSKIHPLRQGKTIAYNLIPELMKHIVEVLQQAILAGGSTLQDYRTPDGEKGGFQDCFAVYDKAGQNCPRNDTGIIENITISQRSSYFCPICQK